jgi:hypothetical protein
MVTVRVVVSQQLELLALAAKSMRVLGGQAPMPLSSAEAMRRINTLWVITVRIIDSG